ncbi:MAG TPA: hypothetical protein VHW25_15725 [Steroidobacteraceae bacterium]|jgi:uncharacterized membrane protein|nr:hypothetical protein [Steroidobacteraceae bacterium]
MQSHFHLLVTVFPSVGLIFVLGLYVAALVTNNQSFTRICLFVFGCLGVLALPSYITGEGSLPELSGRSLISRFQVHEHYMWSLAAITALVLAGLIAWIALWRARRAPKVPGAALITVLCLESVTLTVTAAAAWIGWDINHREFNFRTPADGTPTTWAHIHVILNHFPTVGFVFALLFFIVGAARDNAGMKRASLVTFVICGILGAPTYVTGAAAMFSLTAPPVAGISKAVINAHRDWALISLFGLGATGVAAWVELWRYRYLARYSKTSLSVVLALALITLAVLTETGIHGGYINHPEIRGASDLLRTDPNMGWSVLTEQTINNVIWFVPWQTVHFFGYTLVFVTVMVVCLRILGAFKSMSFSAVHRLLPLGVAGVVMNVFTGMLMLMADTGRYVNEPSFWPKMFFLPIGAIAVLYFSVSDDLWLVKAGDDATVGSKAIAVLVFTSWIIVIMGGRLLPYVTL